MFIHQNAAGHREQSLKSGWLEDNGERFDVPLQLKLNPLAGLGSDQHRWSSNLQKRTVDVTDTIRIAKRELEAGNASRRNWPNQGRVGCRKLQLSILPHERLQLWCGIRRAKHLGSLAGLEMLFYGMSHFYNSARLSPATI